MDVCCEGCSKIHTISAEIELGVAAVELGVFRERKRILTLLETEMQCPCEEPMQHLESLINGENK
jgi:hypothetical protein